MPRIFFILVAAGSLSIASLSCSDRERAEGGTGPGDTERPWVVSVDPAGSATGVHLCPVVQVTFSEAMDAATVNLATVGVTGYAARGRVEYEPGSLSATVTLDTLLSPSAPHSVFVTDMAKDLAGNGAVPFSSGFATGPLDCAHVADRLEPNDDTAAATPATPGRIQRSLTVCGDDKDLFRIDLADARKITVTTPILHASTDSAGNPGWQIHFLREDGQYFATLGTSADPGESPDYFYSFRPGSYFVELYSSYGFEDGESIVYDLEVASSAPCQDDAFEDNDFADTATPLTIGNCYGGLRGCHVDQDCYSVAMTAGQSLTLTVDATIPAGAWDHRRVRVRPPGGDSVTYNGSENPVILDVTAGNDGNAAIDVRFWVDGVEYSLDLNCGK